MNQVTVKEAYERGLYYFNDPILVLPAHGMRDHELVVMNIHPARADGCYSVSCAICGALTMYSGSLALTVQHSEDDELEPMDA